MKNALVIIDMQRCYVKDSARTLFNNVEIEIIDAMSQGDVILLVEYVDPDGKLPLVHSTWRTFVRLLENYDRAYRVCKRQIDGSEDLAEILKYLYITTVRICGVETECCVARTTNSLAEMMPDIQFIVVGKACGSGYRRGDTIDDTGLDAFSDRDNLTVLSVDGGVFSKNKASSLECA